MKNVKIDRPEFEEADIDVELNVTLPSKLYGVYPRIFLLWLARQHVERQYLPSPIAREIPLIRFDLFTASLRILSGVSPQARQDGLREFLDALPQFFFGFEAKPRKGRGAMINNTILVERLRLGLVNLDRDSVFYPDDTNDQYNNFPPEIGSEDAILETPAFVQLSEKLQRHIEEFQQVPDMQIVRAIAHSPLALDIYADMLWRGLDNMEWQDISVATDTLRLDWPGKDVSTTGEILDALDLIKTTGAS